VITGYFTEKIRKSEILWKKTIMFFYDNDSMDISLGK